MSARDMDIFGKGASSRDLSSDEFERAAMKKSPRPGQEEEDFETNDFFVVLIISGVARFLRNKDKILANVNLSFLETPPLTLEKCTQLKELIDTDPFIYVASEDSPAKPPSSERTWCKKNNDIPEKAAQTLGKDSEALFLEISYQGMQKLDQLIAAFKEEGSPPSSPRRMAQRPLVSKDADDRYKDTCCPCKPCTLF